MFFLNRRFLLTGAFLVACAQLVTGCLTTGSAVRPEAPLAAPPLTPGAAALQSSRWSADAWRASWYSPSDQSRERSGRDSILNIGSDYRDLEAGLWVQNDSYGLSSLRSSSRGGNGYTAPSEAWSLGSNRPRMSDVSFSSSSRATSRPSSGVVR